MIGLVVEKRKTGTQPRLYPIQCLLSLKTEEKERNEKGDMQDIMQAQVYRTLRMYIFTCRLRSESHKTMLLVSARTESIAL